MACVIAFVVDCKWSEYGEWTTCSKTCGGGIRTSERIVVQNMSYGGIDCTGDPLRKEDCNMEVCPSMAVYKRNQRGFKIFNLFLILIISTENSGSRGVSQERP